MKSKTNLANTLDAFVETKKHLDKYNLNFTKEKKDLLYEIADFIKELDENKLVEVKNWSKRKNRNYKIGINLANLVTIGTGLAIDVTYDSFPIGTAIGTYASILNTLLTKHIQGYQQGLASLIQKFYKNPEEITK